MKTIVTIISLCFLSPILKAQKIRISATSIMSMKSEKKHKKDNEEIKKSTFFVGMNYDKEFDAAVKFAFDKYWKVCPVKYIDQKINYELPFGKQERLNFTISSWKDPGINSSSWTRSDFIFSYFNYQPIFDNYKSGGDDVGLDKNYHMMAIKVIPFIMCFSAEVNRAMEMGKYDYSLFEGLREKVKNYTVIIPKENLDNGRFTELPFKTYLNKYEFLSSEEIYKKIINQDNVENTALLTIGYANSRNISIIDIKTGDLLYFKEVGMSSLTGEKFKDKAMMKLLEDLEKYK
jgi:hypothetical protein